MSGTPVRIGTIPLPTNARIDARIDAQKGLPSGLAELDAAGKVLLDQIPDGVAADDASIAALIGNPETETGQATAELIAASSVDLTRVPIFFDGARENINAPRPEWPGPVVWTAAPNAGAPTFIADGDRWFEASAEPLPIVDPLSLFGSRLLGWWDEQATPPADGADYGTVPDKSASPHALSPLSTGMTDVPQYDADGMAGKPAIYQPAISAMGLSAAVAWGTGALTVALVVKLGPANSAAQYVFNGQNGGTASFALLTDSAGANWLIRRGGTVRAAGPIVGGRDVPHVLIVCFDGDNSFLYDNGTTTTVLTPGTTSPTTFKLGLKQDIASGDLGPAPEARFSSPLVVNGRIAAEEIEPLDRFLRSRIGAA